MTVHVTYGPARGRTIWISSEEMRLGRFVRDSIQYKTKGKDKDGFVRAVPIKVRD